MLAALSITATLAARSSRSVVGDTQSDEEACRAACACSGILFGFQSFGHCPSAASIHSRCAKLVLPSCEPKSRQVESMARIQPHPDQLEVCELPHVRDEQLLVKVRVDAARRRVRRDLGREHLQRRLPEPAVAQVADRLARRGGGGAEHARARRRHDEEGEDRRKDHAPDDGDAERGERLGEAGEVKIGRMRKKQI